VVAHILEASTVSTISRPNSPPPAPPISRKSSPRHSPWSRTPPAASAAPSGSSATTP
jgi:hypothetical protein